MAVLYQNFLGGETDASLTDSGTSLSSPALAAMDAVASPDVMYVTLDPDGIAGEPEVVEITVHTASATTATMVRGARGSTARAHASGVEWVHGMLAQDAAPDYVAYTPTLTQGVTVTTSTLTARYQRYGNRVHAWGYAVCSSAGTSGSVIQLDLPVSEHASQVIASSMLGQGAVEDAATLWMPALVGLGAAGKMRWFKTNDDSQTPIGANPSFALASGDELSWDITYEAA